MTVHLRCLIARPMAVPAIIGTFYQPRGTGVTAYDGIHHKHYNGLQFIYNGPLEMAHTGRT